MKKIVYALLFTLTFVSVGFSETYTQFGLRYHIVRKGENLYRIGLIYDINIDKIKFLNRLSGSELYAGQVLLIGDDEELNFNEEHYKNSVKNATEVLNQKQIDVSYVNDSIKYEEQSKISEDERIDKLLIIGEKQGDAKNNSKQNNTFSNISEFTPLTWGGGSILQKIKVFYFRYPYLYRWILVVIIIFLIINTFLGISIIIKRNITDRHLKIRNKHYDEYRKLIATLILTNRESEKNDERIKYNNALKKIKSEIYSSSYKKYLIGELLLSSHRNLIGKEAVKITSLFVDLGFEDLASQKLNSSSWSIQIKGIRELSQMRLGEYTRDILKLTDHKKTQVRRESIMGLGRLLESKGFRYLLNIKNYVSEWYQLELLDIVLGFTDKRVNSNIYKGLQSKNLSIVIFTIKLINYFNFIQSKNELIELLKNNTTDNGQQVIIRTEVLRALCKWKVKDLKKDLISIYKNEKSSDVKRQIFNYFKIFGDILDFDFVIKGVFEDDHSINVKALKVIRKLNISESKISYLLDRVDSKKHDMIKYFLNPKKQILA